MTTLEELRSRINVEKKPSIGTWMQIPSADIAEILSSSKFYEWIAIDMEHGSFSRQDLTSIVRAITMNSVLPFVRLQTKNIQAVKDIVDFGFYGYIVPMIESSYELKLIKDQILYPPKGKRGVGFSRSNQYGINFESVIKNNTFPYLVGMIETIDGLENLDDILNYEFIDAILVGPYDLSASLGVCGNFESKIFKDAFQKIKETCNKKNIPFGTHIVKPSKEKLKEAINDGSRFIPYSIDSVMLHSFNPKL